MRGREGLKNVPLWLQGNGEMAGIALHAAIFEPAVKRVDLWHLPASYRQGPTFLNVLRVLDMRQAVALAYPRKVMLYDADAAKWSWPAAVAKLYDEKGPLQVRTPAKPE